MSGHTYPPEPDDAYLDAIRRAFRFARELGHGCGPADFLVGIAEGDGPAAAALGPTLRDAAARGAGSDRDGKGYLHMQAQQAAITLASALGQAPGAEHLLVALLDQGTPEVLRTLAWTGLDPAEVRQTALAAIGAPASQPPLRMPPLVPAGTLDRPPLEIPDLDARAWRVLHWRQDHLPLHRVRRMSDREALLHLERAAARRLAERLHLDDDQSHSLVHQHARQVDAYLTRERPALTRKPRPRRPRPRPLRITTGWGTWFGNRWVTARDRLFQLRTIRDYRGCPQP
jgi:hypothetical protein